MNKSIVKEPEPPKLEMRYEGLFGPKIDKVILGLLYVVAAGIVVGAILMFCLAIKK